MRINRYQDVREGDQLFTSTGVHTIGTVEQFVAWANVTVVRPDLTEWSMQLGDHNVGRFTIERSDVVWTCPSCGGHRRVIQGFPLGMMWNPSRIHGSRIVCKACAAWYVVDAGERDPNVSVVEHGPVVGKGDQLTIVGSPFVWTVTSVDGDTIKCRNSNRKSTSFSRSDVLDVVERKKR
jgi:hypothetical protein